MSYLTLEVEINQGKVLPSEPEKLPESGRGLLTILQPTAGQSNGKRAQKRIEVPLIRGDGSRIVNPTTEELDASTWD